MNFKLSSIASVIFIQLIFSFSAKTQNNIQWGPLQEEKHRGSLSLQYLGRLKQNQVYLWLKETKEGFLLEHYDSSLSVVLKKQIPFDNLFHGVSKKSMTVETLFFSRDTINLLVSYSSKSKVFRHLVKVSPLGDFLSKPILAFIGEKSDYFRGSLSPDSSKFIFLKIRETKVERHLTFKTYDRLFQQIDEYETKLALPKSNDVNDLIVHDMQTDGNGIFLLEANQYYPRKVNRKISNGGH